MKFNFLSVFKNRIKLIFNDLLDLIYKRKCIECSCVINEGILCKNCLKTVQKLSPFPQSVINGFPCYSAFIYGGVIKTLIHKLKFKHIKVCAHLAAEFLYDYIKEIKDIDFKNVIIIPVPTHKKNINKRGYNNVLEIAKELSKLTGFEVKSDVLHKIKFTEHQYKLKALKRKDNLKDSFLLDSGFKPNGLVILLDDITTTGSTLEVITELFIKNDINNLICLTLAKTIRK